MLVRIRRWLLGGIVFGDVCVSVTIEWGLEGREGFDQRALSEGLDQIVSGVIGLEDLAENAYRGAYSSC